MKSRLAFLILYPGYFFISLLDPVYCLEHFGRALETEGLKIYHLFASCDIKDEALKRI